jgi:hypothetical protein
MYAVSAGFKTNIKAASRIIGAKVVIGSNTYFTDNIADLTYEATTNPSGYFELGATAAAHIELNLINVTETFETALVQPYLGVDVSGTIEYVPLGKFYVDVADRKKNNVRLVLFDAMVSKLDVEYISSLTYPATITAIKDEICTQAGITFSGSALPAYSVGKLDGYTRREVIGFIAQLAAGVARFKLDGNLTIQSYSGTSSDTITSDSYIDYQKKKDTAYRVDTVTANIAEVQVVKGTLAAGGSNLELGDNPWMTDTFLTDIYNKIKTFTFLPTAVIMQGYPALECGDLITLTTVDAGNISIPIMTHKITFSGGMTSEIESSGESPNVNQTDTTGSISKTMGRIDAKFNNLDANKITTGLLDVARLNTSSISSDKLVISDFTNLCENPDFETDAPGTLPKGFTGSATTVDISGFVNGNGSTRALQINALNGSNSDAYGLNLIPVTPGQQFFVEAEARYLNTAGTTGLGRLGFRAYNAAKVHNSWNSVVSWGSTTKEQVFTKKSGSYTIPAGIYYIQIWVSFSNNGETTNRFYLDNIRIHRKNNVDLIVDGSVTAAKMNVTELSAIAADVGAGGININGAGNLKVTASNKWGTNAAIQLQNADITGLNGLYMKDVADNEGEGLLFLRNGYTAGDYSNATTNYYTLRVDGTGNLLLDGKIVFYAGQNNYLWDGAAYPADGSTITPSKTLAQCPNGWILVWSDFDAPSTANNYNWFTSIVPKFVGDNGNNWSFAIPVGNSTGTYDTMASKQVTIYNDRIVGDTGSGNGTGLGADVVLRHVIAF